MATLLSVYNVDGILGECDASCYDAEYGTSCQCCCGGVNHAVGLPTALLNFGPAFQAAEKFARALIAPGEQAVIAVQLGMVLAGEGK
jgi:hypothetical protein